MAFLQLDLNHFPVYSFCLLSLTVVCHLIDKTFKIPADFVNFSGQNLKTHKYHVLILSSFFHGDTSHLLKELTLVLPLLLCIEYEFGGIYLLCSYFVFGIIGSILTWIIDRNYYSSLFSDGVFLADYIWSRGASGNVYGLIALTSILFGNQYLFQHSEVVNYGLIWCLITNFLFHLFRIKGHFQNNPNKSYPILILFSVFILWFCPSKITINLYLCTYFLHMSVWRMYPGLFNTINRASFIASDYKCHLIASCFGFIFGVILVWCNEPIFSLNMNMIYNSSSFLMILIADGYYGQYTVQKRIKKRMEEKKRRQRVKQTQQGPEYF